MTPPSENQMARSAAGIVIYQPDFAELCRLVASIAAEAAVIGIYANSMVGTDQQLALKQAAAPSELVILRPGLNRGVGAAYNAFQDMALAHEAEFLLLLDQDSTPGPGMIAQLVRAHRRLAAAGERAAVVGPHPVDPEGRPMRLAGRTAGPGDEAGPRQVGFVISSGSLIRVDALRAIGGFRADYFIDAIDVEWCMRAIAGGFSVWVDPSLPMPHRLGRGVIRLPLGLLVTDQPPRRLYTYVRNQLAMLRLPHVPRAHKAKFLLSLPVRIAIHLAHHRLSRACATALVNGVADGLRNRLGPPDRALVPPIRLAWPRRADAPFHGASGFAAFTRRGRP